MQEQDIAIQTLILDKKEKLQSLKWTAESWKIRRTVLENWIVNRWEIDEHYVIPENINEENDFETNDE